MKLLLFISLSVVVFSCSTFDTSLHTYSELLYPIWEWNGSEYIKGKESLIVSIKWKFISYRKFEELGRVKVKGGFRIDFVNKTTMNVIVGSEKHFIFNDKDDFKIAEYYDYDSIKIAAKSSNSHSGNFDILLDNADLANDIERLGLRLFIHNKKYSNESIFRE